MIVPDEAVDMLSVAPTQSETKHEKHFGLFRLFSFKSLNNNSKKLPSIPEVSQERESLDTQPHLETECNNENKLHHLYVKLKIPNSWRISIFRHLRHLLR
jgi:hypothetical protein